MFNLNVILTFVSWILMIGNQIVNLTLKHLFGHNSSLIIPNGVYDRTFDNFVSKTFQWYIGALILNMFTNLSQIFGIIMRLQFP
jgi:hypothetical protein